MHRIFVIPLLYFFTLPCLSQEVKMPIDYVNPFIGATVEEGANAEGGYGKTIPGAITPFGMVQLSPNTITGWDNGNGYSYEHPFIEGFAFTQLSGVGCYGDLGNLLVTPSTGSLKTHPGRTERFGVGYRSAFSKKSELASPGYYAATLTDKNIRVELTAAPHSGIMRFTFPENNKSRIQIDLGRRVAGTSTVQYVKMVGENSIEGWMKCTPEGGGMCNGNANVAYSIYFYARFSKPLKNFGVWNVNFPANVKRDKTLIESEQFDSLLSKAVVMKSCREKQGQYMGFYSDFSTSKDEAVLFKAGISYVSMQAAKNNLQQEIPDWDFDKVKNATRNLWNDALNKIIIEEGTQAQKEIFYTALYHTQMEPRTMTDIDGSYPGGDGNIQFHKKFTKRTMFGGWDVFRAQFPLQTIINPQVVNDMINSLVELAELSGKKYLERWELMNSYTGVMVGNPANSIILDAYRKGIRNFDIEKAYVYARNSCDRSGNAALGYSVPGSRSISMTLENAYSEWCVSQLAEETGRKAEADIYRKLADSYRNVYDASVQSFRPRESDGSWMPWPKEGRMAFEYGCTEANPYQQGWFVPHDVEGLTELLGGRQKTLAELTNFIDKAPKDMYWNDYYNQANETDQHALFLFNRLGAPWLTQKWVRKVCKYGYQNTVKGYPGDEDSGQMSAWYILAASGFYPLCPGDNRYELCSPIFNKITYRLNPQFCKGKTFIVTAKNNSDKNCYIQSARLNGKPHNRSWITYDDINNGGTLEFDMGEHPSMEWGIE